MNPGSAHAQENGCTCPKEFNHDGEGMAATEHAKPDETYFMVATGCPLHGHATWRESR